VCSWAFDPLGDYRGPGDMPNRGCAVPQMFDLRARIEDQGNLAPGIKGVPISGIAPDTTTMYVLDDTSQALVVDMDGDGECDGINPLLIPTTSPPTNSRQVMTIRLVPVPPKGSGDFTPDPSLSGNEGCYPGQDMDPPPQLCHTQSSTVAIGYPSALDPQAAVWTIEPIIESGPWCVGGQFDTCANQITDGWVCFAAAGADRNGNEGVSKPLQVWVQKAGVAEGSHCPAPPANAGAMPDCTGTYDPATKTVTNKPCHAPGFGSHEQRWQEENKTSGL
jgi:hypothetical protein